MPHDSTSVKDKQEAERNQLAQDMRARMKWLRDTTVRLAQSPKRQVMHGQAHSLSWTSIFDKYDVAIWISLDVLPEPGRCFLPLVDKVAIAASHNMMNPTLGLLIYTVLVHWLCGSRLFSDRLRNATLATKDT